MFESTLFLSPWILVKLSELASFDRPSLELFRRYWLF
jgi:hypothetical protein